MSEFVENLPIDRVFSEQYWAGYQPAPPRDFDINEYPKYSEGKYPGISAQIVNYLNGEPVVSLARGTDFSPNGAAAGQWFTQPGTILAYDYESLTFFDSRQDLLLLHPHLSEAGSGLIMNDETEQLTGLGMRALLATQLSLHDTNKGKKIGEKLPLSLQEYYYIAQIYEYAAAYYERVVRLAVIETYKGKRICRGLYTAPRTDDSAPIEITSGWPTFYSKHVPFEIGQAVETTYRFRQLERFREVDILREGSRELKTKKALAERLGKVLRPRLKPVPS